MPALAGSASLGAPITNRVGRLVARINAKQTVKIGPRLDLWNGELRTNAITHLGREFLQGIGCWIEVAASPFLPLPPPARPRPERPGVGPL